MHRESKVAKLISAMTSAPLICLYISIFFLIAGLVNRVGFIVLALLLVLSPVLPVILNTLRGRVDIYVSSRFERTRYLVYAILPQVLTSILFFTVLHNAYIAYFALHYVIQTIVVLIVNFLYTKVSVHMVGYVAPITFLVLSLRIKWILTLYLLTPAIAWSRYKLKAHTLEQLVLGIILGILLEVILYLLGLTPVVKL